MYQHRSRSRRRGRVRRTTAGDRGDEVGGEWNVDGNRRAGEGMGEAEVRAVEGEAVEAVLVAEDAVVLALAVAHVADQRTRDVLEVAADLVEAAGARVRLHEGVAAEGLAAPDLGDGVDALGGLRRAFG